MLFQERMLFLGRGGGSDMLFNRVNSLNRAAGKERKEFNENNSIQDEELIAEYEGRG